MLSNESRNLLVRTYRVMPDVRKVAEIFGISTNSVYRIVRQMRETGSVELRTGLRGRKPSLSEEDVSGIKKAIEEQPDITIHEIKVRLNLPVSDETVRTKVVKLGLRFKKKTLHATERDRPDVLKKREWWRHWQESLMKPMVRRLVFLDECGVNINMTRLYGRAPGGERVVDAVPLSKPKNTTILSSIRLDGSTACTTFSGGTSGEKFLTYLKETLIPSLNPWDIVVMDNLRTHHIAQVRAVLARSHILLMYLPAYSPDLNPIEMMWSKIKAILRKVKERTVESLKAAIEEAMREITLEDCQGWFRKAGYFC